MKKVFPRLFYHNLGRTLSIPMQYCTFSGNSEHLFYPDRAKSANTITFEAMEQGAVLFEKATFCMNRSYDDNKMFF